jgi:hypothetical protein
MFAANNPKVHGVDAGKRSDELEHQISQLFRVMDQDIFFSSLTIPKLLKTVMKVPGALTNRHGLMR